MLFEIEIIHKLLLQEFLFMKKETKFYFENKTKLNILPSSMSCSVELAQYINVPLLFEQNANACCRVKF